MELATKILTARIGQTYLFFLGQAGIIIKSARGQLLGIDMYLSHCVERVEGHLGFKRLLPQILNPQDVVFDCIVATHPHYDHFDMDAIPELMANGTTRLYASLNCEEETKRLQMTNERTRFVSPGDMFEDGDFRLDFVFCDHGSSAPDAVGIIVSVDGKKIYETGDTCLRLDMAMEYAKKEPFDILIAPINGAYGNMDEEDCAKLCSVLNPRLVLPCHYGMFASHGGNPGVFLEKIKQHCTNQKILLLAQGEGVVL